MQQDYIFAEQCKVCSNSTTQCKYDKSDGERTLGESINVDNEICRQTAKSYMPKK